MDNLSEQLERIGLRRMASAIQAKSLESIRLSPGKRSAHAVTRLGGRPNLSKEIPWPVRGDGQPLSFIAQLDLSVLPQVRKYSFAEGWFPFLFL